MKRLASLLKERKGFTLIELIIVIAILGIILLIGVPKFTDILRDARINADIATASSLGKAVRLWSIKNEQATPIKYIPDAVTEFTSTSTEKDGALEGLEKYFSPTTKPPASFGEGGAYYIVEKGGKIAVGIGSTSDSPVLGVAGEPIVATYGDIETEGDDKGKVKTGWAYVEQ